MDDTVLKLVSGLLVAAAGGLTFIAYKHPYAFKKLNGKLQLLIFFSIIGEMLYNFGIVSSVDVIKVSDFISADQIAKLVGKVVDSELTLWPWVVVPIGLLAYLYFLETFPIWLLDKETLERDGH